ncbi:hypothetical protein [Methylobacterium soli]|uniref:Uncharacterized protein n=1 Tax=Methylobacterium soli TaxID=553447 RepID=A0A6L3T311_9HYPH|nr:hypothetical protein [Methylobacterium soli]KAB1081209.1 hypothetical protein F6X53_02570 [Methylobacterium soli]GJE43427.1 hypothetical protein AEGHOMDF_2606 [Methylobacterium soli]
MASAPFRPAWQEAGPHRPRYRALILSQEGLVLRTERVPADDDPAALAIAETLDGAHAVELWDGLRFIERFEVAAAPARPRDGISLRR